MKVGVVLGAASYVAHRIKKPQKCGHPRVPLRSSFLEPGLPAGVQNLRLEGGAALLVFRDTLRGHVTHAWHALMFLLRTSCEGYPAAPLMRAA